MIHLQIVDRGDNNLQQLIRSAIASGKITAFETAKVKGGLRITHKKYLGAINIAAMSGLLLADVGVQESHEGVAAS
jgi:hypothetical protein